MIIRELVQLKPNIRKSEGASTPPDLDLAYRGGNLNSVKCNDKYLN
jgi:hypothetical protein